MQRRPFLPQVDLDHFLGVVPGPAGIGHEDGLIKAEQRDGHQAADQQVGIKARKGKDAAEDGQKEVDHAFLREAGADLDDFPAVLDRGPVAALKLDVVLDELDGVIRPGADRVQRGAGEPVNDGPAQH